MNVKTNIAKSEHSHPFMSGARTDSGWTEKNSRLLFRHIEYSSYICGKF